jgi:Organic solvent tolerance protein OstA
LSSRAYPGRRHAGALVLGLLSAILLPAAGARARTSGSCPQTEFSGKFAPASQDQRVVIHSDRAKLRQNGISKLEGKVDISRDGREFSASELEFDDRKQIVYTFKPSLFRDRNFIIHSDRASYDLANGVGHFEGTRFVAPGQSSRGGAQKLEIQRSGVAILDQARYTTCPAGHAAWLLTAKRIELNQQTGLGKARDAVLHFQGVPVLWLPWFQFPIDGRRRTGLLFPTVGDSNRTGFDARWPVYINLAPNFDDTFTPRYTSRRGVQLANSFRYLLERNRGEFDYEYVPQDHVTGSERSFIHLQQEGLLAPRLGFDVNFAQVSDINYFNDFGNVTGQYGGDFSTASVPFLPRGASLTYQAPTTYRISAAVQDFQPLAVLPSGTSAPYKLLPQIRLDALTKHSLDHLRAGLSSDFTNFERSDSVQGQRAVIDPYLLWDVDRSSWFASARSDFSYTGYQLSSTSAGAPESPQRALPLYSLRGGMRFDRYTDSGMMQTLEPQLYYLYVPYHDQTNLPVFDTGVPDFDFPQLFARNRYTGEDRIANANQLTSVLTSQFIDANTGITRVSASVGTLYRFTPTRVTLPGTTLPPEGTSDIIGNVDYNLSEHWSSTAFTQVSPKFDNLARAEVELRYHDHEHFADVAYRYRQGLLQQTDASFSTPISGPWRLAGRMRYSLRYHNSLDSFLGVQYQTCCWAISTAWRRYLATANGEYASGVFFQFELRGLTSIGSGFQRLLPIDANGLAPVGVQ